MFDVNVDARRVSRDALDERRNHQKVHIVGCRDYEAPHALRRVEFFASADQTLDVAKDGLDRIDQTPAPGPLASCRKAS